MHAAENGYSAQRVRRVESRRSVQLPLLRNGREADVERLGLQCSIRGECTHRVSLAVADCGTYVAVGWCLIAAERSEAVSLGLTRTTDLLKNDQPTNPNPGDRVVNGSQDADHQNGLKPLPYHEAIRDYLKTEEPDVWEWYASHRVRQEHAQTVRFDLLKSTYRVDRETQPRLYAAADEAAKKLSLDVPITLYQAQNPAGLNASLAYVPDEAHIVLHGPIGTKLTETEFQALMAHELSHMLLWRRWDGEYLIVDQILAALTHDARAETAHFASARLFGLYNEIFCDRGALLVLGDPHVVVSMLVKVGTGIEEVSAESFVRQAEEIFRQGTTRTAELTHPEAFIRARALILRFDVDEEADAKIKVMIEGEPALEKLDLLAQKQVARWTRRLIDRFLCRKWLQSELILAHARLFFEDYTPPEEPTEDWSLGDDTLPSDTAMRDYYCYVLLDFVTADRDLEELPLAAALVLSEQLGLRDRFAEIATKELRLRKRQFQKIDRQKEELLTKATERIGLT